MCSEGCGPLFNLYRLLNLFYIRKMCIAPAIVPDPWDSMTVFYSPTPTLSSHGNLECRKHHESQSCLEGSMEHIRSGFTDGQELERRNGWYFRDNDKVDLTRVRLKKWLSYRIECMYWREKRSARESCSKVPYTEYSNSRTTKR